MGGEHGDAESRQQRAGAMVCQPLPSRAEQQACQGRHGPTPETRSCGSADTRVRGVTPRRVTPEKPARSGGSLAVTGRGALEGVRTRLHAGAWSRG